MSRKAGEIVGEDGDAFTGIGMGIYPERIDAKIPENRGIGMTEDNITGSTDIPFYTGKGNLIFGSNGTVDIPADVVKTVGIFGCEQYSVCEILIAKILGIKSGGLK